MSSVLVIDTGTANIASVLAGLRRAGAEAEVTADGARVASAERVVLPGVGSFGAGMARIRELDLVEMLSARAHEGRPLLAVCLGLQLLCDTSEESPGVAGLGVVPGAVSRFAGSVRVPQIGFNRVEAEPGCEVLAGGHAYFANSYRLVHPPDGWRAATSDHGGPFVAALERGYVVACQFHPELSGAWGIELLSRWLSRSDSRTGLRAASMERAVC